MIGAVDVEFSPVSRNQADGLRWVHGDGRDCTVDECRPHAVPVRGRFLFGSGCGIGGYGTGGGGLLAHWSWERGHRMPFPINVSVGDGSAAAVALSGAAIVLVLVLRPIIKRAPAEDLRFYATCALFGVFAILIAGTLSAQLNALLGDKAAPASVDDKANRVAAISRERQHGNADGTSRLSASECDALRTRAGVQPSLIDAQLSHMLKACEDDSSKQVSP